MLLIISIIVCAILVYLLLVRPYSYWKDRGIVFEQPTPFFGHLAPVVFQTESLVELVRKVYNKHHDQRYVGLYNFRAPSLLLRDPELIKEVTVKEFDSFPEHGTYTGEDSDPLWSNNLFAMPGGDHWKDVRSILSPAFTSSKLRTMFSLISECAKQFTLYLENENRQCVSLDMMDTFGRITNDVIATTAFGLVCDSMKNRDNEFFLMGKEIANISGVRGLKFFAAAISPNLAKFLKIRIFNEPTTNFYRNIIKEAMTFRKETGLSRPDMIHLLMEARKKRLEQTTENGPKQEITDDLITAQAVVFILGGFNTVSTAMSYAAYELALNPDVQAKLQQEIDAVMEGTDGGEVGYEELRNMKYLDMVVSESLRKWPPVAVTDRTPTRTFTIEPAKPNEKPLSIGPECNCQIPIFAIHRDPQYYPNPDVFDPERFDTSNGQKIKPYTYMPFGMGPRSCIGSRFALLEIKMILVHVLAKFCLVPVEKTQIPLVLSKSEVNPLPEGGFWLGLQSRT